MRGVQGKITRDQHMCVHKTSHKEQRILNRIVRIVVKGARASTVFHRLMDNTKLLNPVQPNFYE